MKDSIVDRLQSLPEEVKKTDMWQLAMNIALDNGTAYCDEMYKVVSYYLSLGFTPEEICEQINFYETWNVNPESIKRLFNI